MRVLIAPLSVATEIWTMHNIWESCDTCDDAEPYCNPPFHCLLLAIKPIVFYDLVVFVQ